MRPSHVASIGSPTELSLPPMPGRPRHRSVGSRHGRKRTRPLRHPTQPSHFDIGGRLTIAATDSKVGDERIRSCSPHIALGALCSERQNYVLAPHLALKTPAGCT